MKNASVRFIINAVLLLKLFSVTIYAESALTSTSSIPGGISPGENPVVTTGLNLTHDLIYAADSRGNVSISGTPAGSNMNGAALLASGTWIQVSPASGPYTGTVTLSATLRKIFPVSTVNGRIISFKLDGKSVGSAQTDENGVATLTDVHLPADLNVGPHLTAIKAEFAGDDSYKSSSGIGILTVTYAPTKLTVDNVTGLYGSTVTIRARLISSFTGEGLQDKVITVVLNNEIKGMAATNADGVATLDVELGNMEPGTYPILVTFLQVVGNYSPNTATAALEIKEIPTSLVVSNASGTFGGNATLQAALTSSGAPIGGKKISFFVNGNPAGSATTLPDGTAALEFSLAGLDAGIYPGAVKAEFAAADYYASNSASGDLTVQPAPTELAVSNVTGTFSTTTSFSAKLTSGAYPLEGRTISFKLGGIFVGTAQTDANGTAALSGISLQGYNAGTYSGALTADFEAERNYASSSGSGDLTVGQAPTTLTAGNSSGPYKGTAILTAILTSAGNKIGGMTISFMLKGIPAGTAVTDENGLAVLNNVSLPEIDAGTYNDIIQASFSPSEGNYSGSSATANLEVTPASTIILVNSAEAYYGSPLSLKATLTCGIVPLSGRIISFTVNNVFKGTALTGQDGVAILENVSLDGLGAGVYNNHIAAGFSPQGDNYAACTGTADLTVKELPTSISVSTSTGIYGSNVTLQAALSSFGVPLGDKIISFSVNGNPAGISKTLSDGIASLQFSLGGINAGTYTGAIKAEFAAADNYAAGSATGDLIIQQAPSSLTVAKASGTFSGTADISATLTSGGVPLGGMTVSFKLNGALLGDALTGMDGIAVIKDVSLSGFDAGEYNGAVTADFQASGNYASCSASGSLIVEQAPSAIAVINAAGTYDGKVTLSARLTAASSGISLPGRTLYLKLNGVEKGSAVTGEDGVAALPEVSIAGMSVGTHDNCIEAVFSPSGGNYAPSSGKGCLEIGLAPTKISINKITAVYGSKVDLEATLTSYDVPLSGKPVEFRLNGQFVGAAITGADGKAVKNCIDLTGISAGIHPGAFCATFIEDDFYKGCICTADIEITKACTGVLVKAAEGQYSDQVTLTAVVTSSSQENLNKSGGIVEFRYQLNNGPQHTLGAVCKSGVCDGKLVFDFEFICSLDPDTYKILAEFTPSDKLNFNGSCNQAPYGSMLVEPEDALVEYTGLQYFAAPSLTSNSTSLTLSATIKDTADCNRGDISKARIEFREAELGALYNDWEVQATNLPVLLFDLADNTLGSSTTQPFCRTLSQPEINVSGAIFGVYTKVRGYYTKLSYPSLVTIGIPGNDNISGGGFVVPKSSAGKYRGNKGERTDFGFTMKYNKSCENIPGRASIIIRGENNKIYQVNSSAISSLSAYTIDKMPGKAAGFSASAELIDITNPFNQVTLGRDLCLKIEIYEDGKDSQMDAISITLLGENLELLYSNNWDGTKTLPQRLDMNTGSGTIKVLGPALLSAVEGEKIIPKEYALFQNYPNPFNPSTTIQYDLPEASRVKIAIYDILGKEISLIVDGEIPAGRQQAVWNSQEHGSYASGIYILRIAAESLTSKRNLISAKKMLLIK